VITEALQALALPLASLTPLPDNPRRGDVEAVAASLSRFGQRKPIVVRRSDRVIIAGNHTWLAAQSLGWAEIAAVLVDDDEISSRAYALADNRTSELGGYDEELLVQLIEQVGAQDETLLRDAGWTAEAIEELTKGLMTHLPDIPPVDEAAEMPANPVSQLGDVWLLGAHRVLCGDATSMEDYKQLLRGEEADCLWTDPPYGVDYRGPIKPRAPILNDQMVAVPKLLEATFRNAAASCRSGAAGYICYAHKSEDEFKAKLKQSGWLARQELIWDKMHFVPGHADYHFQHEYLLLVYLPGAGRRGRGGEGWYGDNQQTSLLRVPRPHRSPEHPTMKPIELITICLNNSAPRGGIVLDPFGGSGSTLMACEYTGRRARLMEIEPGYVDVICRRWQEHTGSVPIAERTGQTHDFLAQGDA